MITEELKDKLNIEFRMDISHIFLGYENNMPLDEFNRMLDILVNKATKILITDRASEVGVQPVVMPKIVEVKRKIKEHFESENIILDNAKDDLFTKEYAYRKKELIRQEFYIMLILSNFSA